MKIAKDKLLYKSDNKHHFKNYRPVSLLFQFLENLEKLFNNRLEKHIDKHKLLTESLRAQIKQINITGTIRFKRIHNKYYRQKGGGADR